MLEYKRNPNTNCLTCSKPVYKRPVEISRSKGRVFCSSVCYGISCRKERSCLFCDKPILAGLNKKTCNRSCSNKYRVGVKYKNNQPKNKAKHHRSLKKILLEKRGEKCERCDYSKHQVLQIHHIDRNRKNNKLKNLELICPNCHSEEHYLK